MITTITKLMCQKAKAVHFIRGSVYLLMAGLCLFSYAQEHDENIHYVQFVDPYFFDFEMGGETIEESEIWLNCLDTVIKAREALIEEMKAVMSRTLITRFQEEVQDKDADIEAGKAWLNENLVSVFSPLASKVAVLNYIEDMTFEDNWEIIKIISQQEPANTIEDLRAGVCDSFFEKAMKDPLVYMEAFSNMAKTFIEILGSFKMDKIRKDVEENLNLFIH